MTFTEGVIKLLMLIPFTIGKFEILLNNSLQSTTALRHKHQLTERLPHETLSSFPFKICMYVCMMYVHCSNFKYELDLHDELTCYL